MKKFHFLRSILLAASMIVGFAAFAAAESLAEIPLYGHSGGESVKISEYKGKPLVVNFWAPWCIPCRQEFPELETMFLEYKDKATLIAVTAEEDKKLREDFLSKVDVTFPIFFDKKAAFHETVPVSGMPFTIVLDANGSTVNTFVGYSKADRLDKLRKAIDALLTQ